MKDIIDFIEHEIASSRGTDKKMYLKLQLLKKVALYMSQHEFEGDVDKVIPLIDMNTGYSEYRLVNDCESDNREQWIEYKYENETIRLSAGDFLVKMK